MTTDILEINNLIVLIEQSNDEIPTIANCELDDRVIGFSFYASGNVELEIEDGNKKWVLNNSKGMATSFFGTKQVNFLHKISNSEPLQSVSIFATLNNIKKLPQKEKEIYNNYLGKLLKPQDSFVSGPTFIMTPDMQNAVLKVFNTKYKGSTRVMFLKSQITELLAHFFALLEEKKENSSKKYDKEKLYAAKEIISKNITAPPSLNELSKMIGLNNNKLKKNFKELFGVPVFKYLQNERLTKAHELLRTENMSIQQIAWYVGYESLSSFSNAFVKKFGVRPMKIKNSTGLNQSN